MNIDEGLSQARKDDIAIFITEEDKSISIATSKTDMAFVKNELYETILDLSRNIEKLKASSNPEKMKKDLLDSAARTTKDVLALIDPMYVSLELKGETKEDVITELVDMLAVEGRLLDRDQALADVFEREDNMTTGMEFGVALPHGKTDAIAETAVAMGIKKTGINYGSMDGQPSRLFILVVSPKKTSGLHVQFLAAIGAILANDDLREAIINAATPEEAVDLIKKRRK